MEHKHEDISSTELVALIRYMVGHNDSHNKELIDLAESLDESHQHEAHEIVMEAVKDFAEGNKKLREALKKLEE